MSNRRNIQFTYTPHNKATILDCSFVVDPTNANGYGVSSFKPSGRVANVYMHTSATPATGNPNPASGYIIAVLQDNYSAFLGADSSFLAPLSGTNISISGTSVMTVGVVYVITSLGTSTQANWQAVGLPASVAAAVGVSFVASVTGGGTGTGIVQAALPSGIDHTEVIGNPNLMNSTGAALVTGAGTGMYIIMACYKNTALTAPTALTNVQLQFYLNDSAIGV